MGEQEEGYRINVVIEGASRWSEGRTSFSVPVWSVYHLDEWLTQIKGWFNTEFAIREQDGTWDDGTRIVVTVERVKK